MTSISATRPDGRTIPRTPHTRAMVAMEVGDPPLIIPARRAVSVRQLSYVYSKKMGRKYVARLVPDGSGRLEIYREA